MLFFFLCIKIFRRNNLSEELSGDYKMNLPFSQFIKNSLELLFKSKKFPFYLQYTY